MTSTVGAIRENGTVAVMASDRMTVDPRSILLV